MAIHGGLGGSFANIPPVGTSAFKAYQAAKRIDPGAHPDPNGWSFSPLSSSGKPLYTSALGNTTLAGSGLDKTVTSGLAAIKSLLGAGSGAPSGGVSSGGAPSGGAPSGGFSSGGVPSQPQLADYLDAPWASAYGMSKETAYAEAMENTSYRRTVADMQKAGLNPAVIFGAGNGHTAGSPSYVRSGSSSSGGSGYSRRSSGSGKSSGKLFSSSAYSVLSALGGIVGAAATGNAGGYWIGTTLTQGAMNALNLLSRR